MDRIKASQQKILNKGEPTSHYQGKNIKLGLLGLREKINNSVWGNDSWLNCLYHLEPQAPLAVQSPGVSSSCSPRGYHTPISEEEPPRSFLQAPTPVSAIMTSLDGYLEPQRMSFSSPPASELNPRYPLPVLNVEKSKSTSSFFFIINNHEVDLSWPRFPF